MEWYQQDGTFSTAMRSHAIVHFTTCLLHMVGRLIQQRRLYIKTSQNAMRIDDTLPI